MLNQDIVVTLLSILILSLLGLIYVLVARKVANKFHIKRLTTSVPEEVCDKYGSKIYNIDQNKMIGIGDNMSFDGSEPIHGLRHPPEENTNGWFIWSGELKKDDSFFKPMHAVHILENKKYHILLPYLLLEPGYRFLIDNQGYEDVRCDKKLLDI